MKTILVADDEADLRVLVHLTLEDPGYRILEAADGETALTLIHQERPDLVILDWMMPKKNGIDVVKSMRENQATRDIHVIMLTANDDLRDQQSGMAFNILAYLIKPFSPLQLLNTVREALH